MPTSEEYRKHAFERATATGKPRIWYRSYREKIVRQLYRDLIKKHPGGEKALLKEMGPSPHMKALERQKTRRELRKKVEKSTDPKIKKIYEELIKVQAKRKIEA